MNDSVITPAERTIIRDLARRVAEIACLPKQEQCRRQWKLHNSLQSRRPMIWLWPERSWLEMIPDASLQCQGKRARQLELQLRKTIYYHEYFRDDNLVEKKWVVNKAIVHSGWGLEAEWHWSSEDTGARAFKPVINEPADMKKLRFPEVHEDKAETARRVEQMSDLLGDILDIQVKGVARIVFRLMMEYTRLRGLEQVMMDMVENPEWLHEAMAFFTEGYRRLTRQYLDQKLLTINNDWTYHSFGGVGYTDELPAPGFDPDNIRLCDLWAGAEAQELAQVSPAMHEEFALHYERQLLEPFGLNGYGCCDDLTRKMDYVLKIRNIRRVSVSPFANVDRCAEQLGDKAIFSWKPHPAHLVGQFNEEMIRGYIRHTLEVARANGCFVEMILKDTHTCENHPERFHRWSQIAREEVERISS